MNKNDALTCAHFVLVRPGRIEAYSFSTPFGYFVSTPSHKLAQKPFDSRNALYSQSYDPDRTYKKFPGRGTFYRCGQGESNSRLILGKDPLYHLTMAAVFCAVLYLTPSRVNGQITSVSPYV